MRESIAHETYLLVVLRYILNNPQKAGICRTENYAWSSYALYDREEAFVDSSVFHELLGNTERYAAFIQTPNEDKCLECEYQVGDDNWARSILQECLGSQSGTILQTLDRQARNAALHELKRKGLTVRQIERLTGISRNIVQKA